MAPINAAKRRRVNSSGSPSMRSPRLTPPSRRRYPAPAQYRSPIPVSVYRRQRRARVQAGLLMGRTLPATKVKSSSVKLAKAMAAQSKSSGFFKKGTRAYARNRAYYATYGVTKTLEYSGVTSAQNCIFVGHITSPTNQIATVVAGAILKKFLLMLGKMPSDYVGSIFNMPATATIKLIWKKGYEGNPEVFETTTLTTGPAVFNVVASAIETVMLNNGDQTNLVSLQYEEAGGTCARIMHLKNAKIAFESKSSFKLQNRTTNPSGSISTEVVDETPLYGKSYEGSGSGTTFIAPVGIQGEIIGDRIYGVIDRTDGPINGLQEPPVGAVFAQVKKMGKAHLDPGVVKTSVLTYGKTMYVNTLIRLLSFQSSAAQPLKPYNTIGRFKFFAIEKMINTGTDLPSVVTAWEHNLQLNAVCYPGNNKVTTQYFENAFKP